MGQPSTSKYRNYYYFLWPIGGAVTITDYWNVDVFRTGLLSNVRFGAD